MNKIKELEDTLEALEYRIKKIEGGKNYYVAPEVYKETAEKYFNSELNKRLEKLEKILEG